MGSAVNFEALRRLDLHRIVVASVHGQEDPAIVASGDGIHQPAVHLPNFKGHTLDALGLARFGDLDQLQAAHRGVVEGQGLNLAGLNLNALGGRIQHIPVQCLGFLGGNDGAGLQVGDGDAAILVGLVDAVVRPHESAAAVRHQELHAGQPLVLAALHQLLDHQSLGGGVVEGEVLGIVGVDLHRLGFGVGVDDVPRDRLDLGCDDGAGHALDIDLPVAVRHIDAVGRHLAAVQIHVGPVGVGQLEPDPGQRLLGHSIQFRDNESARLLVPEGHGLRFANLDLDALGGAV